LSVAPLPVRPEGRVPPHDLEAETSVLGAILLDQSAITRVLDFLSAEDFYRENNGQIYRAALTLFREGEPIDNVTLAAELEKMGVLDRVGGRGHLALLQESVPTAANVEHYARIVKAKAYKRALITAGSQVTALGFDDSLDAEEAVNQAQANVYAISDDRVGSGLERLYDLLKPAMDRIDAQMASGGGVIGIPSGFHDLDRMTNGFKAADLVIIAGRPSMGKCLTAGTLIDDPSSGERLTIEEAVRRRLPSVLGVAEDGRVRPTAVAAWVDSGVQEAFRVTTRSGRSVEVTGHHPFLSEAGWQPLHDLMTGDRIAVPARLPVFGSGGPGLDAVRRLAERALAEGRFPAGAWSWDREHLAAFLARVLGGRGMGPVATGRGGAGFTTAARTLAADVQHALLRFGVVAALSRDGRGRWRVEIGDPEPSAGPRPPRRPRPGPGDQPAGGGGERGLALATREPQAVGRSGADLRWDEITGIEPIGRQHVYDLTVPDGANFIAQDVVVHNTSFVLNVALHAAVERQKPIAIFSLEMSKEQLVERMLCEQARIDAQRLHRGMLSEVEYERLAGALGPLGDAPVFIDDTPMLDDLTLRLKTRQARSREGIEMVVLDYLQLMHGRSNSGDSNRVQEVSAISRALKSIARELRIPVIAISQLSRAPEARPDKRPILSDLRESGCLTADTRLLRADTGAPVSIGELLDAGCEGVQVWSFDAERRLRPARLLRVFPSGTKPVWRLRLASGREIKASANHRFLAYGGWEELGRLRVGDRIAIPRRLPPPLEPVKWNRARLALLAHLIGDGCIVARQPIHYTNADEANLDLVEDIARVEFGISPRRERQGNWWHSYLPSPYPLTRGRRNPIAAWLDQFGLYGLHSWEKWVPDVVFGAADEDVAWFLRHLWATDGCVAHRSTSTPGLYYGTSSRRLADDVVLLLGRLGILSKAVPIAKAGYRTGYHVWVRGVDQLRLFAFRIGIHGDRGRQLLALIESLDGVKANTNNDTIPIAIWKDVRREMVRTNTTARELQRGLGTAYCGSSLYRCAPSRQRLIRVAAAVGGSPLIEGFPGDDVFWDRVVEIEPLGEQPVYDGTVAETHNFIANGIVAHNSIEQDADIVMFLYRDEYYNRDKTEKPGIAEIIVAKHRNGPTGTIELMFRKELTRFENLERRRPEAVGPE
jgi:replicative DNA helicase